MPISKKDLLKKIEELEKKLTELSKKYDSKVVRNFLETWEKGLLKLENWVGSSNFLKVFFISGVVGNIAHLVYSSFLGYSIISMGASGAVCGILGTLVVLEPNMKIMLFPIPIPINLSTAMVLFVIFEIACILFSILPTIGHDAHLGGLFAGLLIGKMLEKKYKYRY
jgi:membrane associated rhomboid family serine protease